MKPGWQTTEFWLSVAAALVGALIASGAIPEEGVIGQILGVVAMALVALGYSISRGLAKKGGK